jgi:hypothetical protein
MMVEEETVKLKERSMFFRFARQHCCNYSERGPLEKRHYCWLGPPKTNSICVLLSGGSCGWFVKAVLPLDKALEAEWHRLRKLQADPNALPWAKRERTCACGKRFRFTNNRQLWCEECGRANRQALLRRAKRRQRAK